MLKISLDIVNDLNATTALLLTWKQCSRFTSCNSLDFLSLDFLLHKNILRAEKSGVLLLNMQRFQLKAATSNLSLATSA